MDDEVFSSAKVRLCGSWAAKLASRASDVNFTVLLQPNSLFAMLDAKVRPILRLVYDAHLVQSEGDDVQALDFSQKSPNDPLLFSQLSDLFDLGVIGPRM